MVIFAGSDTRQNRENRVYVVIKVVKEIWGRMERLHWLCGFFVACYCYCLCKFLYK